MWTVRAAASLYFRDLTEERIQLVAALALLVVDYLGTLEAEVRISPAHPWNRLLIVRCSGCLHVAR